MDAQSYNEIARFLEKGPTEKASGALEEILSEDPSRALFTASLQAEGPVKEADEVPLRVAGFARIGFNEGILRPFEMEGLGLAGPAKRVAALIGNLTSRKLPLCIPKSLHLTLPCIPEIEEIRVELSPDGFLLDIRPNPHRPRNTYLEIWQRGQLAHTFPIESASKAASTPLRLDRASLLHIADSPFCAGLRLAPVEFTRSDWISAVLCAALIGDFGKSIRLLEDRLAGNFEGLDLPVQRVSAYLKGLLGVTYTEDFLLLPAPATRSTAANRDRMRLALGVPWAGIQTAWPEVKQIKSPWTPEGAMDPDSIDVPPPARALLRDCIRAFESGSVGTPSAEVAADRSLNQAWRSFEGWNALVEKRFDHALATFTSIEGQESGDLFGIELGAMLSRRLADSLRESQADEESRNSSERIWRFIAEGLLSPVEEE